MSEPVDKPREECGVFGVWGHPEAARLTYLGLYALQHRGQESAGIVSTDGTFTYAHRQLGLVADIFDVATLERLKGHAAVGHVRYSTTGSTLLKNAQPLAMEYSRGSLAVAHNGNLTNASFIRERLESYGSIFQSTTDTEVIPHLMALSKAGGPVENLVEALLKVEGAYSLVVLADNTLVGVRDPRGWRPLVLGRIDGAWVLSSETCALDLIGAQIVREVEPGELVAVGEGGMRSERPFAPAPWRQCVFEHIYFARPDSEVFGKNVYQMRKSFGARLAREHPCPGAELVFAVPDSGIAAATGFSQESGIPYEMGMTRNHYVGRTFIEPSQSIRNFGVKIKLNPNRRVIEGKRVVVVDDSIVRGTTMRKIIGMIRAAGATEVHVRISSPPITHSCYYGIDTPERDKLSAAFQPPEAIRAYVECDSLGYLSREGLAACLGAEADDYCYACFTGEYPVAVRDAPARRQLTLFEELKGKAG